MQSRGTANIKIFSDKPVYTSDDSTAEFTVWVEPVTSNRDVIATAIDSNGDEHQIGSRGFLRCTDDPNQSFTLDFNSFDGSGPWKLVVEYINAEAELEFPSLDDSYKPVRSDNAMLDFARSIDGHQQWRIHGTHPDTGGERQFSEGMPIWSDCPARDRTFRDIFSDWKHPYSSTLGFPDAGEKAKQGSSPPPIAWMEVHAETELKGDLVELANLTSFKVFPKHAYPYPLPDDVVTLGDEEITVPYLWNVEDEEIVTHTSRTSLGGAPSYTTDFGNKTLEAKASCDNTEFTIHYYEGGKCAQSLAEGEAEDNINRANFFFEPTECILKVEDTRILDMIEEMERAQFLSGSVRERYPELFELPQLPQLPQLPGLPGLPEPEPPRPYGRFGLPESGLSLEGRMAILINEGNDNFHRGDIAESRKYFDFVTQIDPENTGALIGKGEVFRWTNQPDLARDSFDRVITLDPRNSLALIGKGDIQIRTGQFEEAHRTFDEVLNIEPRNSLALIGIGDAQIRQGQFEEAHRTFDRALSVEPTNSIALVGKATVQFNQGEVALARANLEHAFELDSSVIGNPIFQNPEIFEGIALESAMQQGALMRGSTQESSLLAGTSLLQDSQIIQKSAPDVTITSDTIEKPQATSREEFNPIVIIPILLAFGLAMGLIPAILQNRKV